MSEQSSDNTGLIIAVVVIVIVVVALVICGCCVLVGLCSFLPALSEVGTSVGMLVP